MVFQGRGQVAGLGSHQAGRATAAPRWSREGGSQSLRASSSDLVPTLGALRVPTQVSEGPGQIQDQGMLGVGSPLFQVGPPVLSGDRGDYPRAGA